ncbi:unnamed protein product [Blepharisma stoltei]|uniref:Uncharacterized protein n=1 Tax=Blepharisma stoltei TaxID=1481888 RepID=A0AAU9K5B1_9CILI|nr:unnamed protein product [Blepharisma stoltei]
MDPESQATGNNCIYCLFLTSAISLLCVGLGNIAGGVAVWQKADSFNWYNGAYIILGGILTLLVILSGTTRKSMPWITIYLFLLLSCLCVEIGFTIGIIFYSDYESILGEEYANAIRYSMLAGCIIVFICFIIGCWYRGSLRNAQFYKQNAHLLEKRDIKYETPRTDAKREEMANKYDKLKEKWEKS